MTRSRLACLAALPVLSACPDVDLSDRLPAPIPLADAVLVPTPAGILAFPVSLGAQRPLGAPVGFLGNPGAVLDIAQRPDGTLFCVSGALTIELPEGFFLDADGDFLPNAQGGVSNLEDSPLVAQPQSGLALADRSVLVTDNSIGKTVVRFGPAGEDLGVFSEQLTFSAPADAALLGEQVIVVDSDQNPRLFRFATDGSFLGAFPQESAAELLVNPIAADANAELLLVVDGLLNVVLRLLPSGELFDSVGAAELGAISDVALLPDGSFVVTDRGDEERQIGGGLRVFGPAGNLVQQISLPELEGLDQPRVIAVANISARPLR